MCTKSRLRSRSSGSGAPSTTSRSFPRDPGTRRSRALECTDRRESSHAKALALKGFGDASVIEIIEDWQGSTYRAVYTVRFEDAVYVLHVFQKKSLRGAETPKADIDLIKKRLREAKAIHRALRKKEKNGG